MTPDQHRAAFEWLEDRLEEKIFVFDVDDVMAMLEQVVAGFSRGAREVLRKKGRLGGVV